LEIKNKAIRQTEFLLHKSCYLKYFKKLPLFRSAILMHPGLKRSTADEEVIIPVITKICNYSSGVMPNILTQKVNVFQEEK
jgi:hypothetical protein